MRKIRCYSDERLKRVSNINLRFKDYNCTLTTASLSSTKNQLTFLSNQCEPVESHHCFNVFSKQLSFIFLTKRNFKRNNLQLKKLLLVFIYYLFCIKLMNQTFNSNVGIYNYYCDSICK